ncbi:Poly A polymerase regulatory subunit [Lotmaria passim]
MDFKEERILADGAPRRAYQNNAATASFEHPLLKGLHYGQRKLILSEIEFFVAILRRLKAQGEHASGKKMLVVYAGAACGLHLPFLFSLFQDFEFILIDPAPFCNEVREIAAKDGSCVLELIEDICTPELCLRIRRSYCETHQLYLVSDIRSGQPTGMSENQEHTAMIQQDNAAQREWCFSLEVEAAMLKFHPPYPATRDPQSVKFSAADNTAEEYVYLSGTELLGVWAPKSSSEVRLVVVGPFYKGYQAPSKSYSCTIHEEQCYAYNIDHRYEKDCCAERSILESYLNLFPGSYASAEQLSVTLSERLEFPLFRPLEPGFTEQHARWVSLLYSAGKPAVLKFFEPLKDEMSVQRVAKLVLDYKDAAEIPTGVWVGSVELTQDFWLALATADFSVTYCFPFFHWAWKRRLPLTRPNRRVTNGKQQKFSGKKRQSRDA